MYVNNNDTNQHANFPEGVSLHTKSYQFTYHDEKKNQLSIFVVDFYSITAINASNKILKILNFRKLQYASKIYIQFQDLMVNFL